MQQSSATPSLHLGFWGLRKIVACSHSSSQGLLVSTVFGTVSSPHPTLFLHFVSLIFPNHKHAKHGRPTHQLMYMRMRIAPQETGGVQWKF